MTMVKPWSDFSFENLEITDLNGNVITLSNFAKVDNAWLSYDGTDRFQLFSMLESCIKSGSNIFFASPNISQALKMEILTYLEDNFPLRKSFLGFLTSGSSGHQKLIVHSIDSLFYSALALIEKYPALRNGRYLHCFPTYYMAGVLNLAIVPLVAQGSITLSNSFGPLEILSFGNILQKFEITNLWINPGMLNLLVERYHNQNITNALNLVLNATGPMTETKRNKFNSIFNCSVLNTYGLTELLFVSGEEQAREKITIGNPLSLCEIRLDKEVLVVRTATTPLEIVLIDEINSAKGTSKHTFATQLLKSEFYTNDICQVNSDGTHFILGRNDDVVLLGGLNISLSRIERAAENFSEVIAACARLSYAENKPEIQLIIEVGKNETAFELNSFKSELKIILEPFEFPSKIVIGKLPKLPSGKIDRQRVRKIGAF